MKFINNVKAIFSDKIVQICIIMCSIIFGIVKTQQGYAPNTVVDNIQRGVGSAICYYLLLNFAYYIFTRDYKFIFLKIKSFPNCIKKDFSWIIAFICLILFVFNFWLFYPGYMMHDWTWVMTNFDLNNHHPILYPFLFKHIATIFGNHIFVPLLFNLIPFYLGIYVLIISCYKKFQSKWCLLGLLPICIGNIFFNNISLHSSYSSPMFIFLLWTIVLYQVLNGITYKNIVYALIAYFFAVLSRHNALIQAYPVCFIYAYWIVMKFKPNYRLWKYIGVLLCFAITTLTLVMGIPNLIRNKQAYPSTEIFLHQIAGACIPHHDETCFDKEWYENGKNYSDVEKEYYPLNADRMSTNWWPNHPFKNQNLRDMHFRWLKAIKKYPADYLIHISNFVDIMWFSKTIEHRFILQGCHSEKPERNCERLSKTFIQGELFYEATHLKSKIYNLLKWIFPSIKTIDFVCLNFILFLVSSIIFLRKRDYLALYILSSSIAGIVSSIFFCIFSPTADPRYIYPVLISSLLATLGGVIYIVENKKSIALSVKENFIKISIISFFIIGGILYIDSCITSARIDIETNNVDVNTPQFEIYIGSSKIPERQADWMTKYGIQGYSVQKNWYKESITINVLKDSEITISLRGIWDKSEDGKLIPHYVKYTDFKINNENILTEPQTVWFSQPFQYTLSAKAGEIYKVELKWRKK